MVFQRKDLPERSGGESDGIVNLHCSRRLLTSIFFQFDVGLFRQIEDTFLERPCLKIGLL